MNIENINSSLGSSPEVIKGITGGFVKSAISIAINGYKNMVDGCDFQKDWDEPTITSVLIKYMRLYKERSGIPINVEPEYPLYDDKILSGKVRAKHANRIDIHVQQWGMSEEIYFTFECKRLNNNPALANEYVKEGMMRFIFCKYTSNCKVGGMIGYLIDGSVFDNVYLINEKINAQEGLNNDDDLKPEELINDFKDIYGSEHTRDKCPSPLKIYHIFCGFQHFYNTR